MEQPKIYNNEAELINWLKYDLEEQRKNIANEKCILLEKVKEEDLTLNIGRTDFIFGCDYIIINFDFIFDNIVSSIYGNIIEDIYFKINCNGLIFNKYVSFSRFNLKIPTRENEYIFHNSVDISFSTFQSSVNLSRTIFYKDVDFTYTDFEKETDLSSNYFYKIVNFKNVKFFDKTYFIFTSFSNILDLSNIKIKENLDLSTIEITNYTKILFDGMVFDNEKIILSIGNDNILKINKLSFKNIFINGIINIQNVEVETADFKGSVINRGLVNPVNFKIDNFANRESALFLKNEAYARRNVIDALKYKDKEMEMHRKELLNKPNKTSKDWFDIISISLSSLYSNNGQNWGKSLFMTILITFVFFNIFYLPDLSQSNIEPYFYKDYFSNLIKYFIPTDYEQIKYYADASIGINIFIKIFGAIIYFAGKIMFWYGSVQTVQAFRKFSKGA
ncbi:hypothetical protein [Brachyspira aalborgi]|uniref:hypothetical protein n=1 Tax=Brachyspira aalborgi TaxID=29522 RepID=UPI002665D322|nr:hypothetical protein [Brachyspira aalborgi]